MKSWLSSRAATAALVALGAVLPSVSARAQEPGWEMRVCADPSSLPNSRQDGAGFENRIAEIIAEELGAQLEFVWFPLGLPLMETQFRVGECDVLIGIPDGTPGVLTTYSYYRSPYVFAYRSDRGLDGLNNFDDPRLLGLKLGVEPPTGPAHEAMLNHGLGQFIVQTYEYPGGYLDNFPTDPYAPIILDIAAGTIDVGVLWGPAAGYYGAQQPVGITVAPVDPPFEPPFVPMYLNMSMGVRLGDESFRDELDLAIARRWDDIYAILAEFRIPTMELPRPSVRRR